MRSVYEARVAFHTALAIPVALATLPTLPVTLPVTEATEANTLLVEIRLAVEMLTAVETVTGVPRMTDQCASV